MTEATRTTQERLDHSISAAVTKTEKKRIQMLAAVVETDVSTLLRKHSIGELLAEAEKYRERLLPSDGNGGSGEAA